MEHLWRDVRHAGRVLARSPLFTLTAVLSLAVGIAGNAAIFALADALLLRDPPGVVDPSRLVEISRSQNGEGFDNFSYPNYADYRDRNTVFTELAAYRVEPDAMGLGTDDGAQRVLGSAVSENYFRVMGVEPALGRAFLPEEDGPNASAAVVVLSHELWRTQFGADPGVLATTTPSTAGRRRSSVSRRRVSRAMRSVRRTCGFRWHSTPTSPSRTCR